MAEKKERELRRWDPFSDLGLTEWGGFPEFGGLRRWFEQAEPDDIEDAFVEPSLQQAIMGQNYQFQRLGYFNVDDDSTNENLVFNRTVALRDSWAKIENKK